MVPEMSRWLCIILLIVVMLLAGCLWVRSSIFANVLQLKYRDHEPVFTCFAWLWMLGSLWWRVYIERNINQV